MGLENITESDMMRRPKPIRSGRLTLFMERVPRFSQSLEACVAHRPAYPESLYELIWRELPPDRRRLAVDLGAGTGISTLPLCGKFEKVIAVEPDEKMAAVIRERPEKIDVRAVGAEDFEQEPGSVDLVTCGTSFHWMDGQRVLANVSRWLRAGGIFALYFYWFPRPRGPAREIIKREINTTWEPFRHPRLKDYEYSRRMFDACRSLEPISKHLIPNKVNATVEWLLGFMYSTSYVSGYIRSLENPDEYLRNFEAEVRRAAPDGRLEVELKLELFLARQIRAT
ncbi:MAG: class I SAM-dependent DNA methyltransferase [Candidatus Acidiferrales bacterium]